MKIVITAERSSDVSVLEISIWSSAGGIGSGISGSDRIVMKIGGELDSMELIFSRDELIHALMATDKERFQ